MSTTALPATLERVRALDPKAADELASAFTRLARAGGALSWAQERLPALLAATTTSAKLEVLVAEGKALTGGRLCRLLGRPEPSISLLKSF